MDTQKGRIEYLDALKGVSIILVVFCHYVTLPDNSIAGNYFMALAWLGVPCFMLTTGALIHQKKTFSFKNHFKKLGILYLCFCVWRFLYFIPHLLAHGMDINKRTLLEYLFLFKSVDGINTGQMWYMTAYFFVMLFYPVTFYLFQKDKKNSFSGKKILFFVMVLSGVSGIILPSIEKLFHYLGSYSSFFLIDFSNVYRILPLTGYANMLFYFILGAFLFEYKDKISESLGKYRILLLPAALLTAGIMISFKALKTGSFYWNGIFIEDGYSRITTVILSVTIYLFFAEYAKSLNGFMHFTGKYIGQHTMGIFYMHFLMLGILNQFLFSRITEYYSFGMNCLKTIAVTFLCVILTMILKKIPVIRKLVS